MGQTCQIVCTKQKLGGLYCVLHTFALDLNSCRHIYMAILQPSLEYGCEICNTNKYSYVQVSKS